VEVEAIRRYCLSFAGARENLQWGDDLCFKVGGKIFAIVSLDSVPQRLCFKCAPGKFDELLEREDIRAAPYLGRYKWAMMERLDALPPEELQGLIKESYVMVAAKMLRSRRPKTGTRGSVTNRKK
jgi:predicted DNA-binding protein (MmcQ/YjbR family)